MSEATTTRSGTGRARTSHDRTERHARLGGVRGQVSDRRSGLRTSPPTRPAGCGCSGSRRAGLTGAEVAMLRFRLLHIPGRLVRHARDKLLLIPADWPWASAFTTCWRPLAGLPDPGRSAANSSRQPRKERYTTGPGGWNSALPRRHATAHHLTRRYTAGTPRAESGACEL